MSDLMTAALSSIMAITCPTNDCQIGTCAPDWLTDHFTGVSRARERGLDGQQIEQLAYHTGAQRVAVWVGPMGAGITVESADLSWGESMFKDFARQTWYDTLQPGELRYLHSQWRAVAVE